MIRLGVNIDHIATLRQVRGGTTLYPNMLEMAHEAVAGGAQQVTIHLREDRRHIQLEDLKILVEQCPVTLNLEMAVTPEMVKLAYKYRPQWCCFVPEKRAELTTEGGLNIVKNKKKIAQAIEKLQTCGIEVSLFIDPNAEQIKTSYAVGADAIEFHTGHWVAFKGKKKEREWQKLCESAKLAQHLGLHVHAGHGLDYEHAEKIKSLPFLREVNIGHSIVCYALKEGLRHSVAKMSQLLRL